MTRLRLIGIIMYLRIRINILYLLFILINQLEKAPKSHPPDGSFRTSLAWNQ